MHFWLREKKKIGIQKIKVNEPVGFTDLLPTKVSFNIVRYALLTHFIAHECGLEMGKFIHTFEDAPIRWASEIAIKHWAEAIAGAEIKIR